MAFYKITNLNDYRHAIISIIISKGSEIIVSWSERSGQSNVLISSPAKSIFLSRREPDKPVESIRDKVPCDSWVGGGREDSPSSQRGRQGIERRMLELQKVSADSHCSFYSLSHPFSEDSEEEDFLPWRTRKEIGKRKIVITVLPFSLPTFRVQYLVSLLISSPYVRALNFPKVKKRLEKKRMKDALAHLHSCKGAFLVKFLLCSNVKCVLKIPALGLPDRAADTNQARRRKLL